MKSGIVNTIVDGLDVTYVNLWERAEIDERTKINGYAEKGDIVTIHQEHEDWMLVEKPGVSGWCNKGFINLANAT